MAGIGFRLKKMLSEDTYTGLLKGYLFSTVISSGPWLISVICLSLLGILSAAAIGNSERELFGVTVVYIYVGTLLATGIFQPVITRLMADELYCRRRETIAALFVSVMLFTIIKLFAIGTLFIAFASLPVSYKLSTVILFVIVGSIWQLMIFLSASSDYRTIVSGFLAGSVLGIAGGFAGGWLGGLTGYLNGFLLGQAFIFFILSYKVIEDYQVTLAFNWKFLANLVHYPELALVGVLSYLGTWVDKFIFWWGGGGTRIAYLFYTYPEYDTAMFLAFLTTVPAMAHFLITIETNFYIRYKAYYRAIIDKKSLAVIRGAKKQIIKDLAASFVNLLKIQLFVMFICVYFAPDILGVFRFPLRHTALFRTAVWGVACYSLVMMIAIVLLYFDLRKPVVFLYLFLVLSNTLLTLFTRFLGPQFYGYGYSCACLLTAVLAVLVLAHYLKHLEFITFINQPVAGEQKAAREPVVYHKIKTRIEKQ